MLARHEISRRRLDEAYVTRVLRSDVSRSLSDPSRGAGFALADGQAEPIVEIQVYPDAQTVLLMSPLFTLELTSVSEVRRSGRRLRFGATSGAQRVGVAISRHGDVLVRSHDETPRNTHWQQGVLPQFETEPNEPEMERATSQAVS